LIPFLLYAGTLPILMLNVPTDPARFRRAFQQSLSPVAAAAVRPRARDT